MKGFFKTNKVLIIVLLLALVIRLVYLFVFQPPLIWVDSSDYDQLALNLANGYGYSSQSGIPYAFREPGYSLFFLAPLYFVFGHSILVVQLFQIFLSLGIALLIFYLAKKYFSKKIALLSVAFFAFYPPFIAYSAEVLTEIPAIFLLILGVFLIIQSLKKKSLKFSVLTGIVLGMLALTRFVFVFLPLFLLAMSLILRNWRGYAKHFAVAFVLSILVLFPWFLRNYLAFDAFVFGRIGSGRMLWAGSYIPWQGEHKFHIYTWPNQLMRGLSPIETDREFSRLAVENIKKEPFGTLMVWMRKPARLFLKSEFDEVITRENSLAAFFQQQSFLSPRLVRGVMGGINVLILLFGLLGVFPALKKNRFAATLFFILIFYLFIFYLPAIPDARYKLPIVPYLMIFSSTGLCYLFSRIGDRKASFFEKKEEERARNNVRSLGNYL